MLPDATIFNSDVNPKEGNRPRRRAARTRRQSASSGWRWRGKARGVADFQLQNSVRALTLQRARARSSTSSRHSRICGWRRESLTAFNDVRRDQRRARAVGRSGVRRARARSRLASLAVPERRQDPGRPSSRFAVHRLRAPPRTHRRGADRGHRRTAPGRCAGEWRTRAAAAGVRAAPRSPRRSSATRRDPSADVRLQLAPGQDRLHRQRRVSPADGAGAR